MTHVVAFAYKPGTTMRLKALSLPATVVSCMTNQDGHQYQIVWYYDGVRRCEWVHEFEIAP